MMKHKKGFTLVELIVVVAIFGILFMVVSSTFINSLKGALKAEATKEARQNGDVIMARIIYDLKRAQNIVACNGARTQINFVDPDGVSTFYLLSTAAPLNQLIRRQVVGATNHDERIADSKSVRINPGSLVFNCVNIGQADEHVDVSFDLEYVPFGNQNLLNTNTRSEDEVVIPFSTTVVNRNIN